MIDYLIMIQMSGVMVCLCITYIYLYVLGGGRGGEGQLSQMRNFKGSIV